MEDIAICLGCRNRKFKKREQECNDVSLAKWCGPF